MKGITTHQRSLLSPPVAWNAAGDVCEGTLSAPAAPGGLLQWKFAATAAAIDAWCDEHAPTTAAASASAASAGAAASTMPAAEPDLCGDGGGDTCGGDGGGEAEEDAAGAWALGFAVFRRAAAAARG